MKFVFFLYNLFLLFSLKIKTISPTRVIPTPTNHKYLIWGNADQLPNEIPKVIWTYWSGARSSSAEACLASVIATNPDFKVTVLNDENLRDYLPDFPTTPNNLCIQLISDLIRLSLLKKYGGIWIDHSIIVTQTLEWVIDAAKANNIECLCFYNEHPSSYKRDHARPVLENGFIAATKGSKFICDWLDNFRKCIFSENWVSYYQEKTDFSSLSSNFTNNSMKRVSYFSCYLAAQETMMKSNNYRLALINVEDDFYFYEFKVRSLIKRTTLIEWILIAKEPNVVPKLVKLRKMHRHVADACIRFSCHSKLSMLGKYLEADE